MNKEYKILLVGMDQSGRTISAHTLKLDSVAESIGNLSTNVGPVVKDKDMYAWQGGGRVRNRVMANEEFQKANAVVFIFDADRSKLNENYKELSQLLRVHQRAFSLAIATKQDTSDAASLENITEKFSELPYLRKEKFHLQGTEYGDADGISEGLDWLCGKLGGDEWKKFVEKRDLVNESVDMDIEVSFGNQDVLITV